MKQQAQAWWKQATEMARAAASQPGKFQTFVAQLAIRDPHISVPATWALQQAGPAAIPALLAGLRHPHPRIRRGCVDIIDHGGYGADDRCIVALLPMLRDQAPHIRRAVWHTLFCERCRDDAKCEITGQMELDRVGLLIKFGITDPNPKLRSQLIDDLRQYVSDPRAVLALAEIDRQSNEVTQHAAL